MDQRPGASPVGLRVAVALVLLMAGGAMGASEIAGDPGSVAELVEAGRLEEAEVAAREALARAEAAHGPQDPALAEPLSRLADVLEQAARKDEALALRQRELALRELRGGPDDLAVAEALDRLGVLETELGRYADARSHLERALAIRKAVPGSQIEVARALEHLADVLTYMGEFADARSLLEQALAIDTAHLGPEHPSVARGLHRIGIVAKDQGDYTGAASMFRRSAEIVTASLGPEHPRLIKTWNMLGIVARRTGNREVGERYFSQALALAERVHGPEHVLVAQILVNWGNLLHETGSPAEGRPKFERGLVVAEKALGPEHPMLGHPLNNLASNLLATGDYARAGPMLERALTLWEKGFGPEHFLVAATLDTLAGLYTLTGNQSRAGELYDRAVAIRMKTFGKDHPRVAESLAHRARFLWLAGRDAPRAIDDALRAEAVARRQFSDTAGALTETEALAFEAIRIDGLDVALTVLAAHPADLGPDSIAAVWEQVVQSRALVLDEMATRHPAWLRGAPGSVTSRMRELESARKRLAELVLAGPRGSDTEAYRREIAEARLDRERVERELAERSQGYRTARRRRAVSGKGLCESLPPETGLVSYVYYRQPVLPPAGKERPATGDAAGDDRHVEPAFLALVLRPGECLPRVVPLGPAAEVEALVVAWRREAGTRPPRLKAAARRAEAACAAAGRRLRSKIWDPVAAVLGRPRRVFVVPDGAIHLANLGALPAADGGYLVENGARIHLLSAERDLVAASAAVRPGLGLLAVGGPDFEREGSGDPVTVAGTYRSPIGGCAALADLRFRPLAAAEGEAWDLAEHWSGSHDDSRGPARVLTGSAATEAAVKQLSAGNRVLHLATHGFFAQGGCSSPADLPSGAPRASGDSPDNPLLWSGLALAGANLRGQRRSPGDREDGMLTAEEIASLDLSGVEWVVLSACETGLGTVQPGEGVLGMRRAFRLAGAQTLIMSLWRVEDASTRVWMRHLYRERLSGRSTDEAVRRAALAMLRDLRDTGASTHPFTWGAFVAAGDWR